jgi:hypothetical protein
MDERKESLPVTESSKELVGFSNHRCSFCGSVSLNKLACFISPYFAFG